MRKYLVLDFIVMVICCVLAVIMSFGTVYCLLHNQPSDSLILTFAFGINAFVCFRNWKNELK